MVKGKSLAYIQHCGPFICQDLNARVGVLETVEVADDSFREHTKDTLQTEILLLSLAGRLRPAKTVSPVCLCN